MEGYKTLKQNARVSFDLVEGPKGLHAINILAEASLARMPSAANDSDGNAQARRPAPRDSRVRAPQFHANQLQFAENK
jgi:hypothetical protein